MVYCIDLKFVWSRLQLTFINLNFILKTIFFFKIVSVRGLFRSRLLSEEGFSAEHFLLQCSSDLVIFFFMLKQYNTWCSADLYNTTGTALSGTRILQREVELCWLSLILSCCLLEQPLAETEISPIKPFAAFPNLARLSLQIYNIFASFTGYSVPGFLVSALFQLFPSSSVLSLKK
jgi:hypothetical protein